MSQGDTLQLVVEAGHHDRRHTPVCVEVPEGFTGAVRLDIEGRQESFWGRVEPGEPAVLRFVLPSLKAGEELALTATPAAQPADEGVAFSQAGDTLAIAIGGAPFTTYHFGPALARPYFHPLLGPGGVHVTRECRDEAGPDYDHVHHKSVWVAHGLVNGADNWMGEPGHAWTRHVDFDRLDDGAAFGSVVEHTQWLNAAEQRILDECRAIRFHAQPSDARCVDFEITFSTGEDAVLFGDTKEGGLLSVRVNPEMNAPVGTITDSFGGINEEETWGKRAHWCDYAGTVDGQQVGVALFDHPGNPLHPTYWHVRNYGLMTANPFGVSHFEAGTGKRGDWLLGAHQEATFRYRLLVHGGTCQEAAVAERYHDYINPPKVRVTT